MAEPARASCTLERPAQRKASQDHQEDPDHEGEHEEGAGERDLGEVEAHGDDAGGQQAGVDDPAVLIGARAEEIPLVGAHPAQGQEPQCTQHQARQEGIGHRQLSAREERDVAAEPQGERHGDGDHCDIREHGDAGDQRQSSPLRLVAQRLGRRDPLVPAAGASGGVDHAFALVCRGGNHGFLGVRADGPGNRSVYVEGPGTVPFSRKI